MAQTLKFGNGTWATKKGSTLAYNDQNENYKPLPFNYTGAGKGTRVNKEGLIEVVENDRPRIDYLDSEDGVFLLEKAATNLITYSEDVSQSYWVKDGSSVTSGFLSPKGDTSAFKLIESSSGSGSIDHNIYASTTFVPNSTEYVIHHYIKSGENNIVGLQDVYNSQYWATINLNTGVVLDEKTSGSTEVTLMSNNFYKISSKFTTNTTGIRVGVFLLPNTYSSGRPSDMDYVGDGTSGIYIWGAQLETGNVASSYIPTQGSAQTRVAETASGSGNSEVFNDSEGVLFADIAALADDNTSRRISISDGSSNPNNLVCVDMSEYTNTIIGRIRTSNSEVAFLQSTSQKQTQKNKIAVKYKVNNFALWINGFEVDTENNGAVPIGLNDVSFDRGNGSNDFYGKTKEIAYYDTVLTDLELETLTSYRTWLSMVNELNLNVIYNG
jgi:hypothetical protein